MDPLGDLVRLTELVPPPDSPVRAFGDWKRFVSVNGFVPPDDYRMLVREYGAGTFGGWARLIEPFNHVDSFREQLERERGAAPGAPHGVPFWPEAGGFLPWAVTTVGGFVGWRTQGRPIAWTTVLWDGGGNVREYPVGAVAFLLGMAEGRLGADGLVPPLPAAATFTVAAG